MCRIVGRYLLDDEDELADLREDVCNPDHARFVIVTVAILLTLRLVFNAQPGYIRLHSHTKSDRKADKFADEVVRLFARVR